MAAADGASTAIPATPDDDDHIVDGRTLARQLRRAEFARKMRALGLIAPLLLFVVISFAAPIAEMLTRSVENDIVARILPRTVAALEDWDPQARRLPGEDAYAAMLADLREAKRDKTHTQVGVRLNYERAGLAGLFRKTPRKIAPRSASKLAAIDADIADKGAKAVLIDADKAWGDPTVWAVIKNFSAPYTAGYFIAAVDHRVAPDGSIEAKPDDERIYLVLFQRTLLMSLLITAMTLLLGYPVAYLLAVLPASRANLLMILVLLPFWTSLLVRTSAWIVLLQQQGVVNDLLVFSGANNVFYGFLSLFGSPDVSSLCQTDLTQILARGEAFLDQLAARSDVQNLSRCAMEVLALREAEGGPAAMALAEQLQTRGEAYGYGDERFAMIFNQTGTVVAMTHILLPFMILPLYSVMKTIPPSYVRAAKSLGATNWTAFWRVYFPNTIPGVGAGVVLVFILAIGYYITPELVGGREGVFISNRIAYHISTSLNWGLASALGALLLLAVLILFYVYDRIVGVDNLKLG